jgi:hypothetical protein
MLTPEEMALLEPLDRLPLDRIRLVATQAQAEAKLREMMAQKGKLQNLAEAAAIAEEDYKKLVALQAEDEELVTPHQLRRRRNASDRATKAYESAAAADPDGLEAARKPPDPTAYKGYEQRDAGQRKFAFESYFPGRVLMGGPKQAIERIRVLRDVGITQIGMLVDFGSLPQKEIMRSLEIFANDVLPHVRDL